MDETITYRTDKRIAAGAVGALFKRNEWCHWFTDEDIRWYLHHALSVVSAWRGRRAVGIAVVTGDGRIVMELSTLVVDHEYRGAGIGTALMSMVLEEAGKAKCFASRAKSWTKTPRGSTRISGFAGLRERGS